MIPGGLTDSGSTSSRIPTEKELETSTIEFLCPQCHRKQHQVFLQDENSQGWGGGTILAQLEMGWVAWEGSKFPIPDGLQDKLSLCAGMSISNLQQRGLEGKELFKGVAFTLSYATATQMSLSGPVSR